MSSQEPLGTPESSCRLRGLTRAFVSSKGISSKNLKNEKKHAVSNEATPQSS